MKHTFTQEDELKLIDLWVGGNSAKEIAIVMERPFNNIRNKIRSLQKQGKIDIRSQDAERLETLITNTSATYGLPIDTVQALASLAGVKLHQIEVSLGILCEQYKAQDGYCYYLKDRIKLTFDNSPSQAIVMTLDDLSPILICRAVAGTRRGIGHTSFINMCKYIAEKF